MVAVVAGVIIGFIIAFVPNGWNIVEPVTGMATLAVATAAWYEAKKSSNSMKKKMFEVSFGLRKGYAEDAETSTIDDAISVVKKWIQIRLDNQLPILTGFMDDKVLIYPVRNGKAGSDFRPTAEPGALFSGSLSPKYDKGRSDEEVKETLGSLALFLGKELKQERVYLSYCDRQWVIDLE